MRHNPLWQSLAVRPGILQPKLTISQADDPYEREADRIADQVMRMPAPQSTGPGLSITTVTSNRAQRKCSECEEEEGKLQRKESGGSEASVTAPPIVRQTSSSPGRPLDAATRAYFEPRFGRSFADVRLHTSNEANAATRAVSAKAFTVGHQIAFAAGQYAPYSETGRRLLAHELTHVAQQERIGQSSGRMLIQRKPVEGAKACVEPPPLDIATVDSSSLECASDLRGASVWSMRLWNFDRDQDALSPCHEAALNILVSDVNDIAAGNHEITGWSVTSIVGHASPEGDENYNEGLALRRAEAVFSALGAVASQDPLFGSLAAPVSGSESCGQGAPRDNYPYFRAVDVTIEFFAQSPPPEAPQCGGQPYEPKQFCCQGDRLIAKNPILNLEECPNRVANGRNLGFDGCSFPDVLGDVFEGIPDPDAPGGGPFTDASLHGEQPRSLIPQLPCDVHDKCYQTCYPASDAEKAKSECDKQFWEMSLNECKKISDGTHQHWCIQTVLRGRKYFFGPLRQTTQSAFNQRQREYCDCCP